ncbi:aldehyde dehydrogenase family protein [Natrinema versiforme]|uniref:Aldehyde Dehydrogenase n=1 Tax=Natrinema versiforme JCM 10478 TaxID=1227496 RepID=L9XPC1_9EURY|nr:aldehyde dehydrogenase family protein [Natrinema versiforme]ELY63281.1 Aldehyde Dehydrogenase [Natrinema versiforme JCM 10478]
MGANGIESDIRDRHLNAHERATANLEFAGWIDGETYAGTDQFAPRDPVTDDPIVDVAMCTSTDVDTAVDAAWDAFDDEWSTAGPADRAAAIREWAGVLADHLEELTLLESLDTGKPIGDARGEVEGMIRTLEYYASLARTQRGAHVPTGEDVHLYTRHEPFGVVGGIVPWNFPAWVAAWKLGPALAAGNTAVLKPAKATPLTTIRIAQLSKAIFPDGVINVVPGSGAGVGGAIADHDGIRKVSFTGSSAVGRQVMERAAETVTPVTLELGSKSPFIVFPDADLDRAANAVADGIFYSTGEICDAFSRAIVHEDVYDEFLDRFLEIARSHVIGDPLDPETTLGPLTTASQYETVSEYIDTGQREGATLAFGGGRPDDPDLEDGWYVEPTVFTDVTPEMRIAREEIFGPVQTVLSFSEYDEAIEMANDTEYGLAAGIGTERTSLAHNAAADLEAGVVYVNEYGPILPDAPYGGVKQSGVGRDLGEEALDHYRQTKTVYTNIDEPSL